MKRSPSARPSVAELVTLGLSVLIVGGLVLIAVREELRGQGGDGRWLEVTFDTDHVVAREGRYYVPYSVRNVGASAIESAELWLEVYDGERLLESAEVVVQFLPLQGKQDGIYVTTADPATRRLIGRLESLQFP